MDSLMRRFNQRESEDAFTQRKLITQHITKAVFQNLVKPAYKVPRSNGVQRILMYTDDTENQKKKELEAILDKFYGDESMDAYMDTQFIILTHVDPNSFIVVEWDEFDGRVEHAAPYPFEVSSKEAIYYEFDNNILQTLVVKQEYQEDNISKDDGGDTVTVYTQYNKNDSKRLTSIDDEETKKLVQPTGVIVEIRGENYIRIEDTDEVYKVEEFTHNLGFVPAIRTGFKKDIETDNRTMVSAVDEAVPIMMKIVKANSELDLTMALHAFPQKSQFVPPCKNKMCKGGVLSDGSKCSDCGGSGLSESTSAQEIVQIEMPKTKEEMINLGDLVAYHTPQVDLIKFQDQYVKDLSSKAKDAVYNSDIFSRQEVAETATGKNIDLDNVYDSLWAGARAYSKGWNFFVKTISDVTDTNENLIHKYIFSRDFKLKSLNDLYNDLKLVSDSRADEFVKQSIQADIAMIMYSENPEALAKYRTMQSFFPYSGKTKEEILFIVSNTPPKDPVRVLWESYGWIFDEIALEQGKDGKNFYEFKKTKQKALLDKKVAKIIKDMPDDLVLAKPQEDLND